MKHIILKGLIAYISLFIFTSCSINLPESVKVAYEDLPDEIDFNIHVKPILSDKCYACHGPDNGKIKAGLQLHSEETAYAELPENKGKVAIKPGSLKKSELYHRILSEDPKKIMPSPESNLKLTDYEKAVLIKWIEDGAEYKPHWALLKPEKHQVPKPEHNEFVINEIDNFVIKKLEDIGLEPSKEADKELLLRRLSLDLTGLPPTLQEINTFKADKSKNAYEKQVDRLMKSIHYAEKMTTDWMDVARFSDTFGYQVDRYRDMSPWRDWVIESFYKNRPYDEFLTWQLAGDLLPNATREQILATGFNRLHPQNMEGGIIDEEFRVENVSDRVAVLGDGIMGMTLSCAKCHDHKFDPITQKNYYELFGYFNSINENGEIAWDKTTPVPALELPTKRQEALKILLAKKVSDSQKHLNSISEKAKNTISQWINKGQFEKQKVHPQKGLIAEYTLNNTLKNSIQPNQKSKMDQEFSAKELPSFVKGHSGNGLLLNGDSWLDCKDVGIFKRSDPFSIGLWVNIPSDLEEGVIFHKNKGTSLHSLRGYHLNYKNKKLEWVLARTYPENAIIEETIDNIPTDQWVQLTVTYDGSSKAAGSKIYVNGKEAKTKVKKDNLTKEIIFNYLTDIIYKEPIEPNLQIGARWRGKGIKNAKVDDILVYNRTLSEVEILQLNTPGVPLKNLKKEQLEDHYLHTISKDYQLALAQLKTARMTYADSVENIKEVMVMKEMETPRKTYILDRGVYDAHGEEVFPNTPESILPMPENLPKNRLGLAQWLTHKDNPLTARVAVNRYWQNYFGTGIVKSSQDFGNQGDLPTHPELLDWLAINFVESGWDVKALQKLIVMSATYRQSSYADEELLEKDIENKWLARGPSVRLTSEMLRDNALAASGLLNKKVGGESVYPYQPDGLWSMNFDPYPQDTGDKLYRRSMYAMWRRTIPNPTLATFDQPERNVCTVKRQKTNTPLQALVLMNDPTFIEAAKVIGEQISKEENTVKGIKSAYMKLTGKTPNERELKLLHDLQQKEYKIIKSNPEKRKGWLTAGEYKIDPKLDQNLVAANAILASVIINGDVSITKR